MPERKFILEPKKSKGNQLLREVFFIKPFNASLSLAKSRSNLMDLRAFIHTQFLVFLFICLESTSACAFIHENDSPLIPYEVKFADVTFQLTDVTRYLIQTELKNIQADKKNLHQQLDKFNLFLPLVEPIFKEKSVPDDFKYLMIYDKFQASIERTTSFENGVFWCLDREKADDVDLIVNDQFDERKHLISATKGAAICFKRNQVLYRNWASTLFSHIADKKILNLLEINKKWAENPYILLDSPAYSAILQFLAYKIALEREFPSYKPNIKKIVYEYPYSKGKTLNKIALDLKVELETLSEYNKWLNTPRVPETDCKVLVVVPTERYSEIRVFAELSRKNAGLPVKDLGFPILKKNEKFVKGKSRGGVFYLINDREGLMADMCDSPVTMAYKAKISIERFVEFNDMKETDLLTIGQVYYIQEKSGKASVPFHVVREGETLWDISQLYGVRLANLLDFNRFETVQRLKRGRVIWLQSTRPKNKPVEYIEMPEEMAEIEEIVVAGRTKNIEKTQIQDTIKTLDVETLPKDIDLQVSQLSKEIEKEQSKVVDLNDEAVTKKEFSIEVEPSKLPLSQEIVKENQLQQALKIKEAVLAKSEELPNAMDLNAVPLSRDVRKENPNNNDLSKNADNQQVSVSVLSKEEQAVPKEKQNLSNNKPLSEGVGGNEENQIFLDHIVKKGETLFRISVKFNVAVSELWSLNNLASTILEEGKVLKIKRK